MLIEHRLRRCLYALGACLILLAAGCSDGPGANGRRIVDSKAGLSYELPSGWEEKPSEDLLEYFSSASGIETGSDGNGAILSLGPVEGLFAEEAPDLATMAEGLATDFAEFFIPFEGGRNKAADEALKVGGRDAHRVKLEITPDEAPPATVEAVVVMLDEGAAFALGVVSPQDEGLEQQTSAALESLDVTG